MGEMDLTELSVLNSCKACDFAIQKKLGAGANGLVVSARCTKQGTPNPAKIYAVKLLFNFTHEYTSVVRNAYENEWLILSRLLPHENVVRFCAQFISPIPESFVKHVPQDKKDFCRKKNRSGQMVMTKGQFLVLDYHPFDLEKWITASKFPCPLQFETLLNIVEQILEGVLYLEKNRIRHLDMRMDNMLVSEDERVMLCDFGCAIQFPDSTFALPYVRGSLPGGNKAHLAPEVLNTHHKFKRDPTRKGAIDYSKQASFAVGVLIHEIATGTHPLLDYPLGHTEREMVTYDVDSVSLLPGSYPKSFCSIVTDMLCMDTGKRLSIEEALNQLRVCCIKKKGRGSVVSLQADLERVKRERDLAKVRNIMNSFHIRC